jgi:hypothetical protein
MKQLKAYIECGDAATPANTMGMGNPGQIDGETLTEPIATAKCDSADNEVKKKKKKKHFKTLAESIFGDNITNEIPVYEIAKKLRKKDIAKVDEDELKDNLKLLFDTGDQYSAEELENHPVDLYKNIIITKPGQSDDVHNYIFIFNKDVSWCISKPSTWKTWMYKKSKNWSWSVNEYWDFNRYNKWSDKVKLMNNTWRRSPIYSVLPEEISQLIIKGIPIK